MCLPGRRRWRRAARESGRAGFPIGLTIGNNAPTTRRVYFARSPSAPGIMAHCTLVVSLWRSADLIRADLIPLRPAPRLLRFPATSALAPDGSTVSRRLQEIEPCAAIAHATQTQPRPPTRNESKTPTAPGALRTHGWRNNQSPLA